MTSPSRLRSSAALVQGVGSLLAGAMLIVSAPAAPPVERPASAEPPAKTRFAVLDSRLKAEPVDLVSITAGPDGAGEFTLRTREGTSGTRPLKDILAIVPGSWARDGVDEPASPSRIQPAALGLLELTDGQRWPGSLGSQPSAAGSAKEPPVFWRHPRFGTLALPIDLVRRYSAGPSSAAPSPSRTEDSGSDEALLRNGDRMSGVIERFGLTVGFAPAQRGSEPVSINASEIVEARFNNPPQPRRGPMVWIADGTVARVESLGVAARGKINIRPVQEVGLIGSPDHPSADGETRSVYRLEELAAYAPNSARLIALAELKVERFEAVKPLLFAEPVRIQPSPSGVSPLNAADVLLPGPMLVEWNLPPGAKRLSLSARLADEASSWGDCTVRVWTGKPGTARPNAATDAALNADKRSARLDIDLSATHPGDRLFVAVEPGARGPIQDRVVLSHAIILVEPGSK